MTEPTPIEVAEAAIEAAETVRFIRAQYKFANSAEDCDGIKKLARECEKSARKAHSAIESVLPFAERDEHELIAPNGPPERTYECFGVAHPSAILATLWLAEAELKLLTELGEQIQQCDESGIGRLMAVVLTEPECNPQFTKMLAIAKSELAAIRRHEKAVSLADLSPHERGALQSLIADVKQGKLSASGHLVLSHGSVYPKDPKKRAYFAAYIGEEKRLLAMPEALKTAETLESQFPLHHAEWTGHSQPIRGAEKKTVMQLTADSIVQALTEGDLTREALSERVGLDSKSESFQSAINHLKDQGRVSAPPAGRPRKGRRPVYSLTENGAKKN